MKVAALVSTLMIIAIVGCSAEPHAGTRAGASGSIAAPSVVTAPPGGTTSSQAGSFAVGRGPDSTTASNDLVAQIEQPDGLSVELVIVNCPGDCTDVVAVAHGGNPPYLFSWEDGSTEPRRTLCPNVDGAYTANVTDSAITASEFSYTPQTASVTVKAQVVGCNPPPTTATTPATVYWADWQQPVVGTAGSAQGTLSPPSGDITISYTGEVNAASQASNALFNSFAPESTFKSSTVANGPSNPGMIAISGDVTLTQTIRFSAPVKDPLMAVWSLGFGVAGSASTWELDAAPTVLSSGPNGYSLPNSTLTAMDNVLTGIEGSGVVQFTGVFSTITFKVTVPEGVAGYGGFTLGMRSAP